MRLLKTEVSLLPSEGFELSNKCGIIEAQGITKETAYAIPFDLKIPGWLPQSFENDRVALSYGLIATVKLGWSDQVVKSKTAHEAGEAMDVDGMASSSPIPIVSASSPILLFALLPPHRQISRKRSRHGYHITIIWPSATSHSSVRMASDYCGAT